MQPAPIPEIDAASAKSRLDAKDALFVDIRDPGAYGRGHIPGALHVTDANVGEFVSTTDKSRPVIVCCYHGNSSKGATAYFLSQGFTDVKSLAGGFEGWRARYPDDSERSPS